MRLIFLFISLALSYIVNAQYTMSNQTVDDCFGTLSDSEANTQQQDGMIIMKIIHLQFVQMVLLL